MSTRGIVAVGTLGRWKGVYNHSDSYPKCLGKDLYEHLTEQIIKGGKNLAEIGAAILMFDDWRNYISRGVCQYCGKIASQAHNINMAIYGEQKPGVYRDPECKQHCHEPLEKICHYTRKDVGKGSDIEWAYIINPKANRIHVLDLYKCPDPSRHVGDMTFDAVPDFEVLECGTDFERCGHMAWAHVPEVESNGPQHNLNTKQYLGLEPLEDLHTAFAVIVDGRRYTRTGSGVNGAYAHNFAELRRQIPNLDPEAWYESVKAGNGRTKYLPAARLVRGSDQIPYPGVTWVFPPTKVNPAETLRSA